MENQQLSLPVNYINRLAIFSRITITSVTDYRLPPPTTTFLHLDIHMIDIHSAKRRQSSSSSGSSSSPAGPPSRSPVAAVGRSFLPPPSLPPSIHSYPHITKYYTNTHTHYKPYAGNQPTNQPGSKLATPSRDSGSNVAALNIIAGIHTHIHAHTHTTKRSEPYRSVSLAR